MLPASPLAPLASPIADDAPCGPDLADTGALLQLEALTRSTPVTGPDGRRKSDDDSELGPDWGRLAAHCLELLQRTRDLRILALHAAAALRTEGLPGFAAAIALLRRWLETFGTDVHPQPLPDDPSAALERWHTVAALGAPFNRDGDSLRIVEGLRAAALVKSDRWTLTFGAALAASGTPVPDTVTASGTPAASGDTASVLALWAQTPAAERRGLRDLFRQLRDDLVAIDRTLRIQTPEELIPFESHAGSLHLLVGELDAVARILGLDHADATSPAAPAPPAASDARTPPPGTAATRADALRLLREARGYFERTEPSSPVPYLIDRVLRVAEKDFLALLEDIAPDALPHFQSLAGLAAPGGTPRT